MSNTAFTKAASKKHLIKLIALGHGLKFHVIKESFEMTHKTQAFHVRGRGLQLGDGKGKMEEEKWGDGGKPVDKILRALFHLFLSSCPRSVNKVILSAM